MTHRNDILTENAHFQADNSARLWHLMPPRTEASVITVVCHPRDFSASALARAVEDSNAHLLNLNVTGARRDDGLLTIELRTSLRHPEATIRSLSRYGFETIDSQSFPADDTPADGKDFDGALRNRAAELIHILNL